MIYVGTCGYAYKDWVGPFYPPKTKAAEMLPTYARRFLAVEIDSSYYGVPKRSTVASMDARTPDDFRFSFKLPATVTHPPVPTLRVHDDARELLENLEPLRRSGKLACVLAQFPNGFKPEGDRETYLRNVIDAFAGVPVVVEFRNHAWQRPQTLHLLRELGAGFSNVDMPRLDGLLGPSSDVTGAVGYVRFHGRNAKQWWTGTNVTRYAYTYDAAELVPWTDRVAEIAAQAGDTYAFFNNHESASAAKNAEMLEALLDDRFGPAADEAVAHAPGGTPQQAAFGFAGERD